MNDSLLRIAVKYPFLSLPLFRLTSLLNSMGILEQADLKLDQAHPVELAHTNLEPSAELCGTCGSRFDVIEEVMGGQLYRCGKGHLEISG